jgi:hypothetical protein
LPPILSAASLTKNWLHNRIPTFPIERPLPAHKKESFND